jgi:large subunit ribosomal protein L22
MKNKYSIKIDEEKMAKSLGKDLPISMKFSTQICNAIKKKNVKRAKIILQDVIDMKKPIAMKRFNRDLAHKRGMGPARYPVKAAEEILKVVEQVESNAQFKGFDTSSLIITHIKANKASAPWHYGRKRRRKMKRTHIEIVVTESKEDKEAKPKKRTNAKDEKKEANIKNNTTKAENKTKEAKKIVNENETKE